MGVKTRLLFFRLAVRTAEHERGVGEDVFAVLKEEGGDRHCIIVLQDKLGAEVLNLMQQAPGEPTIAHELFADILKHADIKVIGITLSDEPDGTRPATITFQLPSGTFTKECGPMDAIGFSIATGVPMVIEDTMFAMMCDAAPSLAWLQGDPQDPADAAKDAERLALLDDDSHLGKA